MDKKIHLLYEWKEITYPSPSLNGAVVGFLEQLNSILLNSFYCRSDYIPVCQLQWQSG